MAKAKKIDDATLRLLYAARQVEKTNHVVVEGKLSPADYAKVKKVFEGLGGAWNKKAKATVFERDTPEELAAKLDGLMSTGEFVSLSSMGFFPTPDEVASLLFARAEIFVNSRVLEPSAGTGNLALTAARRYGATVTCVEIQKNLKDALGKHKEFAAVFGGNFLAHDRLSLGGLFDRVIMNPPFAAGQDIAHVAHAWNLLHPGGRLVAVMSPGFTFRQTLKYMDFNVFVMNHGRWENLPDGSFRESGTDVRTVLVTLDKPKEK